MVKIALSDLVIISSIIVGLVSIPFLVTGPLSDNIPTGRLVLGMNDTQVEGIPNKMTKIFSSDKYEKVYETAFGRFTMRISAGEIFQELSKPGKITVVSEDTEKTTWRITTQEYKLEIVRRPNSVVQTCNTPDGMLKKIKENGEVTEEFQGMNQEGVISICSRAELDLQEEVDKMEQIKSESEIPSTETKNIYGRVKIREINVSAEWVKLVNTASVSVDMTGWKLMNGKETGTGTYTYTFNNFTLPPNGYVYVYSDDAGTTNCTETETTLCWSRSNEWDSSRDIAILINNKGEEVSRCVYIKSDVKNNLVVCS
ncbi:MAG: lamin tail domain-containing protein [Candidatus Aenigmatarchaeota archaeon]